MKFQPLGVLAIVSAVAIAAQSFAGPPAPLAEPFVAADVIEVRTYGGTRNVELLADLLAGQDVSVRERAVRDLGQTHNVLAIEHLRRGLQDGHAKVRAAAACAAAEFDPAHTGDIIIQALADADRRVVFAALRSVRSKKFIDAAGHISRLLDRRDATIQAVALQTLTQLRVPATAKQLKKLLGHENPAVRLYAVENAVLLERPVPLLADLRRLASSAAPAVRGAALEAMGRFAFESARPLLMQYRDDPSPLVRRGVLYAFEQAGRADRIRPFLDDESALVRLAATAAAGRSRCTDCVERLFELMLSNRDNQSHIAARQSLSLIGTPAVAALAGGAIAQPAKRLSKLRAEIDAYLKEPDGKDIHAAAIERRRRAAALIERNIGACCRLLAELKSKAGYEQLLLVLTTHPIDSPELVELSEALGRIGDPAAAEGLKKVLDVCVATGPKYLIGKLSMPPRYVPYSEEVTASIITALAALDRREATESMLAVANTGASTLRLNVATLASLRAGAKLLGADRRQAFEKCVLNILNDRNYSRRVRFEAAKLAGKLSQAEAVDALKIILYKDRECPELMHAAAWAIQTITGKTPTIPERKIKQGQWIITTTR
ncbi:MAG: HEAT repeat domain-containing protein [Planctomycetota bacterium]|nr:HEAT repeat domain-containing protein [Planctomycetota bacterium]